MLVFSCHADTGFRSHSLTRNGDILHGNLDNFAGVYALMKAYFSGRLNRDWLRIELTYGEETDFAGAIAVRETITQNDFVVVVDVTGAEIEGDFTIEKCTDPLIRELLEESLDGLRYELFEYCPDPVCCCDESDIYRMKTSHTAFIGVLCFGGDYNAQKVSCREGSIEAVTEAICRLVEHFGDFCRRRGIEPV